MTVTREESGGGIGVWEGVGGCGFSPLSLTGETETETVWYLATNLPLTVDVVAVYAMRMQMEESFRDYKREFGLEREQTKDPVRRLPLLLRALGVVVALKVRKGQAVGMWRPPPRRARRWTRRCANIRS